MTCSGYYSPSIGDTGQYACPRGSYSDTVGSFECTLCPAGTYYTGAAEGGSTSSAVCTTCPFGLSSVEGATVCTSELNGAYNLPFYSFIILDLI